MGKLSGSFRLLETGQASGNVPSIALTPKVYSMTVLLKLQHAYESPGGFITISF